MPPRRALSIRQPYAELILRGIKTIEYRSRRTRIIGERFYIYAARTPGPPEAWAELDFEPSDPGAPTGVIVGSATITRCTVVRASRHGESPTGPARTEMAHGLEARATTTISGICRM
ncbi:MAG: ASCH domain-containing protein [Planctomycetes bacterium]|nr:ASCH domain-containing protein [Planctomycetota bacterium]